MSRFQVYAYVLTLGFELALCAIVYLHKLWARLPFFASHAFLMLSTTILMPAVYHQYGFRSLTSFYVWWCCTGLVLIARFLTVGEFCRYGFRAYRGVWALTLRIILALAVFCALNAAVDASKQLNHVLVYGLTLERDLEISSFVILVTVLAVRHYYRLNFDAAHYGAVLGMSLLCGVDAINNTVLHSEYTRHLYTWLFSRYAMAWPNVGPLVSRAENAWNLVRACGLVTAIGIWCVALRKPLPQPAEDATLLPPALYWEISPQINLQLRALNDRLVEMLKP